MGKIPTDHASLFVSFCCDFFHFEELAGVVLDAAEHDQGDFGAVFFEGVEDVGCAEGVFAGFGVVFCVSCGFLV